MVANAREAFGLLVPDIQKAVIAFLLLIAFVIANIMGDGIVLDWFFRQLDILSMVVLPMSLLYILARLIPWDRDHS